MQHYRVELHGFNIVHKLLFFSDIVFYVVANLGPM